MPVKDIAGQRYHRLLVLSRGPNTEAGSARWNCLCDCGSEKLVLGGGLRSGHTKSCGCLNLEVREKNIANGLAGRWERYQETKAARECCGSRVCLDCGQQKPLTEYGKNSSLRDGTQNRCRACSVARVVDWYGLNMETRRSYARGHYHAHADVAKQRTRDWRERNPEKVREMSRRAVDGISAGYAASLLKVPLGSAPTNLINLKREQLYLRRLARALKQAAIQSLEKL